MSLLWFLKLGALFYLDDNYTAVFYDSMYTSEILSPVDVVMSPPNGVRVICPSLAICKVNPMVVVTQYRL